jgi:putative PIN family toxin of toxin-antitoxin system
MMRFVLDSGVLIAAVVAPRGVCGQLLRRWLDAECELIVSPALLDELEEVLLRRRFRRYLSEEEVRQFVHLVAATAELVADPASQPGLTRDPDDDYLVALARATSVDALVSGDADLSSLPDPMPPILSPRATLARLNRAREARASDEGELQDAPSSTPWLSGWAWSRSPRDDDGPAQWGAGTCQGALAAAK